MASTLPHCVPEEAAVCATGAKDASSDKMAATLPRILGKNVEIGVICAKDVEAQGAETSIQVKASSDRKQIVLSDMIWMGVWLLLGGCQGFVAVKCLLVYPKVLADQFVFKNFVVLKMFIGAVGTSMVTQGGMSIAIPEVFAATRGRAKKSYGLCRVMFGLSLMGMGMAMCGDGPSMLAPCLGGGVKNAWGLLPGGIVATLLVGVMDKIFKYKQLLYYVDAKPLRKAPAVGAIEGELIPPLLVDKLLGRSYTKVSLALGFLMLAVGFLLEIFIDFRADVEQYGGPLAGEYPASFLDWPAWPPLLAGIFTGLGQLPMRMVSRVGLGGTSSLITVVSTLTCGKIWPKRTVFHSCYQMVHNYGWVLAGALFASFTSGTNDLDMTNQPITDGFSVTRMAIGMFLCMFGSMFGGGCTCGHGVTGISEMNVESWIGGATIFAGAIATRYIMVFGFGVEH